MNRKQFLAHLLRKENTVRAHKAQECMICQEEYGTGPSGTDPSERQIRLPCDPKHTVGSVCIATWLQAHNTCPVCRHEFFPAERQRPEPLYIGFDDDDDDTSVGGDDSEDEDFEDEGGETDDEDMSDGGDDDEDDDFVDEEGEADDEDSDMSDVDEDASGEDGPERGGSVDDDDADEGR